MSLTLPTCDELISDLCDELGEDSSDAEVVPRIGRWLNEVKDDILTRQTDWKFTRRNRSILTTVPYSTGTVTVTQGSKTVTGSGTSWSTSWANRLFWIPGISGNFQVGSFTDTDELLLEDEWTGESASGQTYQLVQNRYPLDNEAFEAGISGILDPEQDGPLDELDFREFIQSFPNLRTFGSPSCYAIWGEEDQDSTSNPMGPMVYFDAYPTSLQKFSYFYHRQFGTISGSQKFPIPYKWNRTLLMLGVRIRAARFDKEDPSELKQQYEGLLGLMIQENSKTGKRTRRFRETDISPPESEVRLPSNYPKIS